MRNIPSYNFMTEHHISSIAKYNTQQGFYKEKNIYVL